MSIPLTVIDLDVSSRARNSLVHAGINMIYDLREKSASDLLEIPYLGTGQLTEIQAALAWHGMSLAPDAPVPPPLVSARQAGQRARRQMEREARKREVVRPAPPPLMSARQAAQRARRQRERAMSRSREDELAAWVRARREQA